MMKKNARSRDYELPLDWLLASNMIMKSTNLTAIEIPENYVAQQLMANNIKSVPLYATFLIK